MPIQHITQRFTEGMNSDMQPVVLDMLLDQSLVIPMVSSVSNMIFERGLIRSRPGTSFGTSGPANKTALATTTLAGPSGPLLFLLSNEASGTVYRLHYLNLSGGGSFLGATEITGPGLGAFANWRDYYLSGTAVNGNWLLGGNNLGIIRITPALTYTLLTPAYAYVAKMKSRALAAFGLAGGATDQLKVAWSAAGDETVWTAPTGGSTILSDAGDVISGLKVVKGVIVVARTYGFHLGYPTGTFPDIFNWQLHSDESIGVTHPATFQSYKNVLYFVSDSGIHTFDLVDIEDIGEGILQDIIQASLGATIRGFISTSFKGEFRPTYNLYVDKNINPSTAEPTTLWMYDITAKKWSIQKFTPATNVVYSSLLFPLRTISPGVPSIGLIERYSSSWVPKSMPIMINTATPSNTLTSCESVQSFTTGKITFGVSWTDAQLSRVMLFYQAFKTLTLSVLTLTITCVLGNTTITENYSISLTTGTGWRREWLSGIRRQSGQQFQLTFSFQANMGIMIKEAVLEFTDAGEMR